MAINPLSRYAVFDKLLRGPALRLQCSAYIRTRALLGANPNRSPGLSITASSLRGIAAVGR
ncbi:MAG: hypothetical protein JWQ23_2021, partial [Herminiimonas sp.]|nr:hypothetical protein [Herminiimonas sp.]